MRTRFGRFHFDELKTVVEQVKAELAKMTGVSDVEDNFPLGNKEVRVKVDEEKAALFGLDVTQIASTIRIAFEGKVATVLPALYAILDDLTHLKRRKA